MSDEISLDEAYDDYPRIEEAFQARLDESLDPRGPASLFDLIADLGLPRGAFAVDVGCGEGEDALELASRFGFRVKGVDPVARHVELARAAAAAASADGVEFARGSAEELPVDDATADLVWCKEVLMYADLDRAFRETARVLSPSGIGFVYQVLTGPNMTDAEALDYWEGGIGYGGARSVRPSDIEDAITSAGLVLRQRIDFGGEWGEYAQEQRGAGGRRLVHAARLLRDPQRYIDEFGESNYRIMLGDCLWHVYRMIGKLHGAAFVFEAQSSRTR